MKHILRTAILIAALAAPSASYAEYPERSVTVVVPYAAGGSVTDIVARLLADPMKEILGVPVVVENLSGAGGSVASVHMLGQKPDGYRIILGTTGTMVHRVLLHKEPQYSVDQFTPVARIAYIAPFVLVARNDIPAAHFAEFVEFVNKNDTTYATGNEPSMLAAAEFLNWKGLKAVRDNHKNEGLGVQAMYNGTVSWMFLSLPIALPHIKAGKMKVFATLGGTRHPSLPDVPTVSELGAPELTQRQSWLGFFGPPNMPAPVAKKIAGAVEQILERPEIRKIFSARNLEIRFAGPEELLKVASGDAAFLAERIALLRKKKLVPESN